MTPRTYSDGLRDAARMIEERQRSIPMWAAADLLGDLACKVERAAERADAELPPPPPSATFWLGEQGA